MAKSVKLKLTLSDSTIIESNTFTIPDGPTGPAGVNGLEALVYKTLTLIGNDPIVGRGFTLNVQDFNRTPMVGEYLEISGYTYSKAKTFLISGHISAKVDDNNYTFTYDEFVDITGEQGPVGPAGKDGAKGETGATGQTGPAGPYPTTCEVVEV